MILTSVKSGNFRGDLYEIGIYDEKGYINIFLETH